MEGADVINTAVADSSIKKPAWEGWGKVSSAPTCSLGDVMSEELAAQLETKQETDLFKGITTADVDLSSYILSDEADTSSDLLLAQLLQHELDKEHDSQLKKEEDKWNGTSKVKVSYEKYRSVHPAMRDECFDEEEVEEYIRKDISPNFNKMGICGKGKNIITKHDAALCSRKNATKVMENFPPEFETGDGDDLKLPNHVYNKLKIHSNIDSKRSNRLHEKKEHSTAEQAVDAKTRLILYKLVNSGLLDAVNGVISAGKESVVFHADGGRSSDKLVPHECALKVFKTTLVEFKNRCQYIKGDVRFFKDEFKKQNPRKIMKIWASKEEMNLRKMERVGVPCPSAIVLKKHVLVMNFIGDKQNAAPKLKHAKLSLEQWTSAYQQCVQSMKKMYKACQLVHADLSEYNMLWHNDIVYFIDVAQAVDAMHPHALEFLLRDCTQVSQFFSSRGVADVLSPYELFNNTTGLELQGEGAEFLSKMSQYEKDERTMKLGLSKTDYPFDYFFDLECEQRKSRTQSQLHDDDDDEEHDDDDEDDEEHDDDEDVSDSDESDD